MHTKFIVVVGGVISGVGKGVATASIGKILQSYGYSVTAIKIDPYINFDAGTLRPTEHGEVWVTDDGGEIDQDLGNYERFLGITVPKKNNITTGQVYNAVIDRERKGGYLGKTVQFIPHIPEEVTRRLNEAAEGFDVALIEIGGTIGDYENIPFLFAARSLERTLGHDNVAYVLVTYLPTPSHIEEPKTKPTQQAIKSLSEVGIFPDFILCRAKEPLDDVRKRKIETYANIETTQVISAPDVKSLYTIPLNLEKEGLGRKMLARLKLDAKKEPDWSTWKKFVKNIEHPSSKLNIAIVGKYVDIGSYALQDSYISINESLKHAAAHVAATMNITWLDSKEFEKDPAAIKKLNNYHGVIVPGGFGSSGVEGKIAAIKFCRENNIPYLGLCYGMQLAVIEFARNVCGLKDANTTEVNKNTPYPVIDIQPSQRELMEQSKYGATMRLGAYAAILRDKTKVLRLYHETGRLGEDAKRLNELMKDQSQSFRLGILDKGKKVVLERHRHRYEVNPKYIETLEKKGIVFSGYHVREDKTRLMEYMELPNHPFFVGTQAHPEFKSRLEKPSPLFFGFAQACSARKTG